MRKQQKHPRRMRVATVVAVGASALALASPARATSPDALKCRSAIAKGMRSTAKTGFKLNDKCHSDLNSAGSPTGACNDVTNFIPFDPSGKYQKSKAKSAFLISTRCLDSNPVLQNYDGQDPENVVGGVIDESVDGNSTLTVGFKDLGQDKAKTSCVDTVGKSRSSVIQEVVKNSTNCQAKLDHKGQPLGPLAPSCVDPGTDAVAAAKTKIQAACGSLTPADVGTCTPLPDCVTDSAVTAGQTIAKAIYQKLTQAPPCGNGTVDPGEQCDDGPSNGTNGDPCNTKCESLLETCGPGTPAGGSFIGHRLVTVSLNVPGGKQLAGVQVGFDYPQQEVSIKGTGTSSVVQASFQVLPPPPASGFLSLANDTDLDTSILITSGTNFIGSGPLVTATLDECFGLSRNICNRNQNVIDCCPPADIVACNASPDDPVACFCGAV